MLLLQTGCGCMVVVRMVVVQMMLVDDCYMYGIGGVGGGIGIGGGIGGVDGGIGVSRHRQRE